MPSTGLGVVGADRGSFSPFMVRYRSRALDLDGWLYRQEVPHSSGFQLLTCPDSAINCVVIIPQGHRLVTTLKAVVLEGDLIFVVICARCYLQTLRGIFIHKNR